MCERISVFIRRLSLNAEHSNIVVAHRNAKSTYLKSCLRVCSRQNDNCQFKYIPHKKQRSVKRKLIGKLTVDARFYLFGCSKIYNCFIKLHHILNVWIFASFFQLRNRWRSVLPHWVIRNELITGLENLWILLSDHFCTKYDSLQPFPTSRWFENLQNSWTKFIFQIGSLNPKISMSTLHSTELFLFSRRHNPTKNAAPFSANTHTHTPTPLALTKG